MIIIIGILCKRKQQVILFQLLDRVIDIYMSKFMRAYL